MWNSFALFLCHRRKDGKPCKLLAKSCSEFIGNPNQIMKFILFIAFGVSLGFLVGIGLQTVDLTMIPLPSSIKAYMEGRDSTQAMTRNFWSSTCNLNRTDSSLHHCPFSKIFVPGNPRGTERLPPNIIVSESDLYPRRLIGSPSEDLQIKQKYLVTFTVGYDMRMNIDAAVKKFSGNFTIMLFHYDGRTSEWDEFEWSKKAIHVSAIKQTKWWFAKRFLHPDIVAPFEYIFIWDEDLDLTHLDGEEYVKLVKKHGLEISQPGVMPGNRSLPWQMTRRQTGSEVHKETKEAHGRCSDPHLPPCAAFVEIMAPVFSRDAWRCVWHMIQNDLVHGWGLDFSLRRCVEEAHERMGVVDSQWIIHQGVPSLKNQGEIKRGNPSWTGVLARCKAEWKQFQERMLAADMAYNKSLGIAPPPLGLGRHDPHNLLNASQSARCARPACPTRSNLSGSSNMSKLLSL